MENKTTTDQAETVVFAHRPGGPERLVADAEVHFHSGLFAGLKLTGFTLWRSVEGEVYPTVPSRSYGAGGERRYYDFLRSIDSADAQAVARVKAAIVDAWRAEQAPRDAYEDAYAKKAAKK